KISTKNNVRKLLRALFCRYNLLCSVNPPSTVKVFAVINEESSETKSMAALDISSEVPRRSIGVISDKDCFISDGVTDKTLCYFSHKLQNINYKSAKSEKRVKADKIAL